MARGIYIMANDSVMENAIALLNSIRCYDAETPIKYFDFSTQVSDMPIFNYIVLRQIKSVFNIARGPVKGPGGWAGSGHFTRSEDHKLFDPNVAQPLKYLHWAGIKIKPGCPYWDIWEYYRNLENGHLDVLPG